MKQLFYTLLLLLTSFHYSWATTFTVTNTNDAGVGSLRQAILDANADGTASSGSPHSINFATTPGFPVFISSALAAINNHIIMNGLSSGTTVERSGAGFYRIFDVNPFTVTFNNLIIRNGNPGGANQGGGIRNNGGILTLNNCVVDANFAGAAAFGHGGGVAQTNGVLAINNSTIKNNDGQSNARGGAMYIAAGTVTLTNCTVQNNKTLNNGGAIYNVTGATLNLINCTVVDNVSGFNSGVGSGGVFCENHNTLHLTNTILANNSVGIPAFIFNSDLNTSNINPPTTNNQNIVEFCLQGGGAGSCPAFASTANPMLDVQSICGIQDIYRPLTGSFAINNGTAVGAPAADICGTTWFGNVDIGNVESVTPGTMLHVDGADDYVDITSPFTGFTNEISVEAWVNINSFTADGAGIGQATANVDNMSTNVWMFQLSAPGTISFYINDGGTWRIATSSTNVVASGWHHIIGTANGTETAIWVDGNKEGTDVAITTIQNNPAATIHIGKDIRNAAGPFFNGDIDELRIWTEALCLAKITARKDCELVGNEANLVSYYNFNQGAAAAANLAETSLLDRQTNIAVHNGILTNMTLAGSSSNWVEDGNANGVTGSCSSAFPEINLVGNSVSIVNNDVTPSLTDHTDFGNTSTSVIRTFTVDNTVGTAPLSISMILKGGTNPGDFTIGALTPASPVSPGGTATFTVTFAPGALGARTAFLGVFNDDCDEDTYIFNIQGTGVVPAPEINLQGNSNNIVSGQTTISGTDDTDFGNVLECGTKTATHTFTIENLGDASLNISSITSSNTDFTISGAPVVMLAGDVTTFDVIFDPTSTATINSTITINSDDADEAAYTFVVEGVGISSVTDLVRGNALVFDGVDDLVSIPHNAILNITTAITMECWIKTSSASEQYMATKQDGAYYFGVSVPGNLGKAGFYISGVSTGWLVSTSNVNDGLWHHIASSWDNVTNTISIYVDGVLENSIVRSGTIGTNALALDIGSRVGGYFFNGELDQLRLWNTNRTANEIRENMHLTLESCANGLVAYYQMNEGSGTTILDNSGNGNNGTIGGTTAPTWIASSVNVGHDATPISNSQTITSISAGISTQNFAAANLSIDFTTHSGAEDYTVTYQNYTPNSTVGASGATIVDNPLWTINKSTSVETQTMDLTFTFPPATLTSTNICYFNLYNRTMNADANWTLVASAASTRSGDRVTFKNISVTGQFMVVEDPVVVADIVRGDALDFDGTDDYINIGSNLDNLAAHTMEAWAFIRPTGGFTEIISQHFVSGLSINQTSNKLHAIYGDGAAWTGSIESTNDIPYNRWVHLAASREAAGNVTLYINGVANGSFVNTTIGANANNRTIGATCNGLCQFFSGQIDEVRMWNTARTAEEIRENMHLTLNGCNDGLIAYYQMNDGILSPTVIDQSGNGNTGTLTNMDPNTDWVVSSINIGHDVANISNSQTITAVPAGLNTQTFAAANASMRFFQHSGVEDVTITYQQFTPNATTGVDAFTIFQTPMWTVNKSTTTEKMLVDYTFTFPGGTFTSTDADKYGLYWRAMYAGGAWTKISTASAVTTTTALFGKISLTGQFMVVQESDDLVSDVRGNMYNFDGIDDYISTAAFDFSSGNTMSIEVWVKPLDITTNSFYEISRQQDLGGFDWLLSFQDGGTILSFGLNTSIGGYSELDIPILAADYTNGWHHIAAVYDGATKYIYVDGVLVGTEAKTGNVIKGSNEHHIGRYPLGNEWFDGSMDEIRFWNTARTQNEIRQNMHLTLKGNEAGLVSYYQFNNDDVVGTVGGVKDAMGTNHGTAQNMAASEYVPSEVAVASGTSDVLNIAAPGEYTFPNTGAVITFGVLHPNGEVVVSRLETEKPHGYTSMTGDVDNEYFVINNYGSNSTFDAISNFTLGRMSYIAPTDAAEPQASSPLDIYKRRSNEYGATWGTPLGGTMGAAAATAGTNGSVSYNTANGITSFSQFVVVNSGTKSDLPVELLYFDAERKNSSEVNLTWATATETNNQGFEVQRMLEHETEFAPIGWVDGQGNTVNTTHYQLIDNNDYQKVSYYRLKQLDTDGTFAYSAIRAVNGTGNNNGAINVDIYPNPVKDKLTVRFNDLPKGVTATTIRLMSIDGKTLHQFKTAIASFKQIDIDFVKTLPSALYTLSVELDNGENMTQKFIKE